MGRHATAGTNWSTRDVTQRRALTELRPTKRQLGTIRSLEKRLGRRRRWVENRAEATYYFRELRGELNAREARERERNPDQWGLPAAETQLFQLRQAGVRFTEPLTRRQAQDLIDNARESRGKAPSRSSIGGQRPPVSA
ncbi:MAG TPA: hypothetical protein VHJ54_06815 [Solirubrobacterales bacterium]|jgi:hypothetical protein|nr:hypothetical protein [Solirubrobacterales bacterium]